MDRSLRAGITAFKAGDNTTATALFSKVVRGNPKLAEGWFWLGKVAPEREKQRYCFRRALKLDPDYAEARQELVLLGDIAPESKPAPSPKPSPSPFVLDDEPASASPSPFSFDFEEEEEETVLPPPPPQKAEDVFSAAAFSWEEPESAPARADSLPTEDAFMADLDAVETAPFEEEVEDKSQASKAKSGMPRRQRVILVALVIGAVLSILGLSAFFFLYQPDFLFLFFPPTPTLTPPPSPTPTLAPTPTLLPFSTMEMAAYTPSFEESACTFSISEGENVTCGFVTVPEDRYGDVNDTIRLAVTIYAAREPEASAPPIVYLQGGPGKNAILPLSDNDDLIASLNQTQDFIVFDQRGTGLSEPVLDCPDLKALYQDIGVQQLPFAEREAQYTEAATLCRDEHLQAGVNLAAYNSFASAQDIKDILQVRGYEKATLLGVSYGTRLAQVFMREYPELVHAAILDSPIPVDAKVYHERVANSEYALSTLFAGCAADPACAAAYPNLENDLLSFVSELNQVPLRVNLTLPGGVNYKYNLDGRALMNAVLWGMRQPESLPWVPRAIERARMNDISLVLQSLEYASLSVLKVNLGAYLAVSCREQIDFAMMDDTAEESTVRGESIGLGGVYSDSQLFASMCEVWQIEKPRPDEHAALVSDVPVLLMAGEYDSATPPLFAEQIAAGLSRATLVNFPAQGHVVNLSQTSACPLQIMEDFIRDPYAAPDTACAAAMPSATFSTPYLGNPPLVVEQVVNYDAGVSTLIPQGWVDLGSGFYYRAKYDQDVTQVGAQKVTSSLEARIASLKNNFNEIGLDSYPAKTAEENIGGLTWTFYTAEFQGNPVDLAFAQSGYDVMMVAMVSHVDEREIYREQLFKAMLENTSVLPSSGDE